MTRSVASLITGRKTKYLIIVFWLALVTLAGPLAGKLTSVQDNEAKSWLPGGEESTHVLDRQAAFASPDTIPAVVVYQRSAGLTEADRAKVASDAHRFGQLTELDGQVGGPIFSGDGQAAQLIVPLNLGPEGWDKAGDIVTSMKETAQAGASGLSVHVTGPAGSAADSSEAFAGIDGRLLFATIGVVVVILLFTYRSPGLWLLPVISAGVALTAAQAVIYLLAKHAGLTVNAQSAGILTVLVFGAGTDYALLLVARYREELRRHTDRHEAMAVALHRAGPAIVASAGTVVVGMLCLIFAETNSTKGLGPVAAIGVLVGLAVMLTLLPAMLVTVGRWIFWPARPRLGSAEPTTTGLWAKIGNRLASRPRITWVTTTLALAVMVVGLVQLDATGLTNKEAFRGTPDSIVGEEVLAGHFPAGAGNPVVVISKAEQAAAVKAALASTEGIDPASVSEPVAKNGFAYIVGTLNAAPDSPAAFDTVDRVRDRVHAVPGADAQVGGNTAINLDLQRAARYDRNLIIPIVLVVVLVILALLLRAIVAPLVLVATVVLSFGAALGTSALVFRHVFGFGGADSSLPLFVFVFLVALGIDYNIFLMTRVREEAGRYGTRRAARIGLAATGGVITSAGLVLAGTFAVLATLPLTAFAEIGFAVAFGVLLDTIIVRAVLVTALNLDIGRHMWWPSRLGKIADVEPAEAAQPPSEVPA
ncbi:putative drug exporter of the RND superfamily [Micromonospora rhizosphaerae]|uniref:Putative drug exporter of the RND superfamily n=1 Tax=Micromonospora rhizosphaerae TaxID=568872 RepID=A0A1C6SZ91_9ACTN|nr:MMPL family transporter [Micromonospora rhizosphaerae]SCL34830.1 putative drug exporter of the RND superfamily [Micromonospora rhizosphaerae]